MYAYARQPWKNSAALLDESSLLLAYQMVRVALLLWCAIRTGIDAATEIRTGIDAATVATRDL